MTFAFKDIFRNQSMPQDRWISRHRSNHSSKSGAKVRTKPGFKVRLDLILPWKLICFEMNSQLDLWSIGDEIWKPCRPGRASLPGRVWPWGVGSEIMR